MPPQHKRAALIGVSAVSVLTVSALFIGMSEKKAASTPRAQKPEVQVVSPNRMTGVEQFGAQMDAITKQMQEVENLTKTLKKENEELKEKLKKGDYQKKTDNENVATEQETLETKAPESMEQKVQEDAFVPNPNLSTINIPAPLPNVPVVNQDGSLSNGLPSVDLSSRNAEIKQEQAKEIKVIGDTGEVSNEALAAEKTAEEKESDKVYIPSGSMFTGVLLNGLDAPTSSVAKKNPMPVVVRVKREAVLPNYAAIDVRECFLMAAGYGQLSSERAMLRSESLSCVRTDGQVFETKIDAYIVGSDGKVGVPGRLVSKQGQMIARSLLAGVFGGMGQALNRARVPSLNLNPNTGTSLYEEQNVDMIFQGGVASGIGTSANMVAKFYLDMAKETFPVVEVQAGEVGTIIVTKGANLPLKGSSNLKQYIDPDAKNQKQQPEAEKNAFDVEEKATGLSAIPDNISPEQTLNAMDKSSREVQQIFGGANGNNPRNNNYSGFGNGW